MCNSWAFCIYQTFLKNLTDNRINQIKKLIKLILMLVFCHVMVLSCNNGKKNIITKKLWYNSLSMSTTSSTIFFMITLWNISPKLKNPYLNSKYGNSLIMTQKNTCRGGLRDLPNMPKLWISLKSLALAQNSNNIKKEKIQPNTMSGF